MSSAPAENQSENTPLWVPSKEAVQATLLMKFQREVEERIGQKFSNYNALWQWTLDNSETFWEMVWDFAALIGDRGSNTLDTPDEMKGAQFFTDSSINYAENNLRRRDDKSAIIFRDEQGGERILSFKELYDAVSRWQQAFIEAGIGEGDRVAGYMPNMPETIIAMFAATSLGAIWSSASPDFGVQGVIDRFGQIKPKILVGVDAYYYNGKVIDCLDKITEIQPALEGLEKTIIVPFVNDTADLSALDGNTVSAHDLITPYEPGDIKFTRVNFNHPLFIMFSSGTTGVPKCIVHGHGGTLIQHVKEHMLQCDVKPDDRVFYFTTCGWMMWNWQVTALACGACLMLFDGSPFYPDGNVLWGYAEQHKCTLFGTSAKYIDALKSFDIRPGRDFDLSSVRTITSTGSPLVHESFDYVYEHIKPDVHLASIYGGTDIISASFGIGNPVSPVYRGEIQGAALGTSVQIFDENGERIVGQAGELVCTAPFPSMPVSFWNDADGSRYRGAYFERYPGIWHHGDWVEETHNHGLIVHGRSDATLNPGGVRIGTAEIYRQVEQVDSVLESIAVGQDWDGDVRVVLFVILKDDAVLNEDLIKDIKTRIRAGASPRHVPAKVISVSDIPRTKSGKITELVVKDIIHGRPIKNKEALANPESLDLYKDLTELRS